MFLPNGGSVLRHLYIQPASFAPLATAVPSAVTYFLCSFCNVKCPAIPVTVPAPRPRNPFIQMARLTSAMVRLSSLERESGGVNADDMEICSCGVNVRVRMGMAAGLSPESIVNMVAILSKQLSAPRRSCLCNNILYSITHQCSFSSSRQVASVAKAGVSFPANFVIAPSRHVPSRHVQRCEL